MLYRTIHFIYDKKKQGKMTYLEPPKCKRRKNPCDQCDYKATNRGTLFTPVKSKHEGVRYPCDQCEFIGSTKSFLHSHKMSKHEGVKYPCD